MTSQISRSYRDIQRWVFSIAHNSASWRITTTRGMWLLPYHWWSRNPLPGALLASITTFTIVLMVACFIGLPVTLIVNTVPDALLPASLTLLVTVAFFIWIVRTQFIRCYRLDANKLVIERFGPDTSFALARLKSVEVDPDAMKRTWAMTNGGLFAFAGNILVVTPEQPDAFARAVTSRTRITQSQVGAPSRERS